MIDGLKPYPAMKDSGVPWLGEVPEHWLILPPKRVLQSRSPGAAPIKNTASAEPREGYVPAFSASGQDVWLPEPMFHGPGLVLSAVGARCGKTFRADRAWAIVANTHVLLVSEGNHRDFWWYVTNNESWWERAGAAQPFVQVSKTLDRPWAVPPPAEQAAIVRFLDHADRRIRRYVRAKQKLIKLLEEQKQAIIHRAVTRGLDPNVRLKPSGVKWLGDVPEHWAIRRIASFSPKITNGWVGPTRDILRADGVPYIQSLHVKRGAIRFAKRYFVERAWLDSRPKIRLREGDVVVVQTGDIGQVACIPSEFDGAGCHALIIIRTDASVMSGPYLDLVLRSRYGFESLKSMQTGALHPHLNCTWVREIAVPVPPLEEQDTILRATGDATQSVDRAIASAESEASLLSEYRTRLIADVVTGKLDVREAAARLPPEAEDLEPLDEAEAESEAHEADAGDGDGDGVPEEAET